MTEPLTLSKLLVRRLQPLQLDLKSCITLGILWLEVNGKFIR